MLHLTLVSVIEKKPWVPLRVRMLRRAQRMAGYAVWGLDLLLFGKGRLLQRPVFSLLANSVNSLPGGGGPCIQAEQKYLHIIGTAVASGNYPGAPGDTFDLTAMTLPPGWVLPSLGPIIMGWGQSIKATGPSGFTYTIVPGSTAKNGTLDVQQNGAGNGPNAEIATSAYPAGVSGDTIQFEVLVSIAA